MPHSSSPVDSEVENARVAALRSYGILDTAREPEFDEIAERAARECGYGMALITFMDGDRCWFKATTGMLPDDRAITQLPREETFCNYALKSSGLLVVSDAASDVRFQDLAIVRRAGGVRAYAGAQLITQDGHSIGSLCVLDRNPRQPTAEQLASLRRLSLDAMALLETRRRCDNDSASPVIPPAPESKARRAVLVVDDEIVVRKFIGYFLRERGIPAFSAENGAEALKIFRSHAAEIGLVITDINMPVMDGLRLVIELRHEPQSPTLVVMSGRLDPLVRAQLAGAGVSRILSKPFALDEMKKVIALLAV